MIQEQAALKTTFQRKPQRPQSYFRILMFHTYCSISCALNDKSEHDHHQIVPTSISALGYDTQNCYSGLQAQDLRKRLSGIHLCLTTTSSRKLAL